jgi:cardiolipin synthase (CMP-forming)
VATTGTASTDRVLTIPNVITVVRLCTIPLFLWLLFAKDDRIAAAALLGALGATDWVDGWIARRYGQVSELGKVLDPTADRILFIVCVGGIIIAEGAPLWFSILVVFRELAVGITVAVLTLRGMKRVDVQWVGKAGTLCLMVAFPFFLGASADTAAADVYTALAWIFGIPGLVLSYYAAITYIPIYRRAYAEGRRERALERA